MKTSNSLLWLAALIVVLALIAAGIGLFYQDAGTAFSFTTVRGDTVQLYGQGLYAYDTPITAVGFKAADAVTLWLAIPLLILAMVLYRRGSLRGGLVLAGTLAYMLYNYASMAFGAAYNNLFLVYVALFSLSLFALVLALTAFDVPALPGHFSERLPRRGISIYFIVSGVILALVWLMLSILPGLVEGKPPLEVRYYTTFVTGIMDIGVIAPVLIVAALLLFRRAPVGYLFASVLLVFTVVLGANLMAGGIAQILTGVITVNQAMMFTVPFVLLTVVALWFTILLLRGFDQKHALPPAKLRAQRA